MLPKSGLGGEPKLEELFFATSQEKRGGKCCLKVHHLQPAWERAEELNPG